MIILASLSILLSLITTAIAVIEFFLLVRLVMLCRPVNWLTSWDRAGERLIADATGLTQRIWSKLASRPLSQRGRIIVSLITLEGLRLLVGVIAGLF